MKTKQWAMLSKATPAAVSAPDEGRPETGYSPRSPSSTSSSSTIELRKPLPASTLITPPTLPATHKSSFRLQSASRKLTARGHSFSLLEEVTCMVKDGLAKLEREREGPASNDVKELEARELVVHETLKRVNVFQMAFDRCIEEFGKYKQFMTDVKEEYDTAIDIMKAACFEAFSFLTDKSTLIESHKLQLDSLQSVHEKKVRALQDEIDNLQRRVQSFETESAALREERAKSIKYAADYQTSRQSNLTLTAALSRLEKENRALQEVDTRRQDTELALKASELKAMFEVDRLLKVVQDLERIQLTLVQPEELDRKDEEIEAIRRGCEHVEATHKQLIQRYIALKTIVDNSETDVKSIEEELMKKVEDALTEDPLIAGMKEKRLLSSRQIIERLLDQVETWKRQCRNLSESDYAAFNTMLPDRISNHVADMEEVDSPWGFYPSLGDHDGVPVYLRAPADEKICNIRLSPDEVETAVLDIWKIKTTLNVKIGVAGNDSRILASNKSVRAPAAAAAAVGSSADAKSTRATVPSVAAVTTAGTNTAATAEEKRFPTFGDFLKYYLEKRFPSPKKALEAAYNLVRASESYSAMNSECKLFQMVLREEIPDDIRADMDSFTALLKTACETEERKRNILVADPCHLPYEALIDVLRETFSYKRDKSINELLKALQADCPNKGSVNYVQLLTLRSDDGNANGGAGSKFSRSKLVEALRMQYMDEFKANEKDLVDKIRRLIQANNNSSSIADDVTVNSTASKGTITVGYESVSVSKKKANDQKWPENTMVTIGTLREALAAYDPVQSRADITMYLASCYGVMLEELLIMEGKRVELSADDFLQRYRRNYLKRSSASSTARRIGGGSKSARSNTKS